MSGQPVPTSSPITAFTMRGLRNGSLVHVTWSDGDLSGDPPTVDLLEVEADIEAMGSLDQLAERTGIASTAEPLGDVATAARLVYRVIDRVTDMSPPEVADLIGVDRPSNA